MRLNSYLAKAGIASRRGADELIKAGRVTVNGESGQLNHQIMETDEVLLDGKRIKLQQSRYILLYKPTGYITTLKDPHKRRKVTDLVKIQQRVIPVGRLDYDTSGVLLLSNDGEWAHKLMHPSFEVEKVYEAEFDGKVTDEIINKLSLGVDLEDGKTSPAKVKKLAENKIELSIHEGRYHQVKRMLSAVDLKVKNLHRSKYSGLSLDGLQLGQWRELTPNEVQKLSN